MAKSIIVYTTPECPYCQLLKSFFKENKVSYTEVNLAGNHQAVEEMSQKTGQ
ncbi:MAG: glutaredoxin family protein, partial [Candidatus Margulisiibacteriota bacterium]